MSNIPKLIHFVWLGPRAVPRHTVATWRETYPDHKVRVWRERDLAALPMRQRALFDGLREKRYNQRSDVARLEILLQFGGVYVDADVVCLRPVRLAPDVQFWAVQEKPGLVSNSLLGATPGHPLVAQLLDDIAAHFDPELAVWRATGPRALTDSLLRHGQITVPADTVHPDILSAQPGLEILPYYTFNLMQQLVGSCTRTPLRWADLRDAGARDAKYWRFNAVDPERIAGLQLWCGGKPENYARPPNVARLRANLALYLQFLAVRAQAR